MSNYLIQRATAKDNEHLCALCNIPLQGNIGLALERSTDFFAGSKIQSEEVETYICRKKDSNEIIGVFSVGKRRVFLKKEIKLIRYFSDLRIHPAAQGSRVIYEICRYITGNNILADDVAQTIVFADNHVMLKLIDRLMQHSKKMSIFRYFTAGNYNCYMVKFYPDKRASCIYQVVKGQNKHIPEMKQFILTEGHTKNFYPYYDFNISGRNYYSGLSIDDYYLAYKNNSLVGIAAVWDQHKIKQTRICGYAGPYKMFRPLINLYAKLTGGFQLPSVGTVLRYLTLHSILVKDNDSVIFGCLVNEINKDYRKKGYDYFLVGLDEKDSLNITLEKLRNKRLMKGKHFLVANKETIEPGLLHGLYYMEAARI